MSQVDRNIDLGALARAEESVRPPRRGWLRILVPLAIVGAFAFVLRDALVELFRDRPEVTLARPVRLEGVGEGGAPARAGGGAPRRLAVQAAGWVEPDPFPAHAPALAGGVVLEMLVQESDVVAAGDPVARLVADDARIAREMALQEFATKEAAVALARVRAGVADERFDAALEVTEAADVAAARRVGREAEATQRAAAVREGEALVALAESEVVVQRELEASGVAGVRAVEIAEADLEAARAKLAALRAHAALAVASAEEARAADERARRDLELRFADRLARDETAAAVELAVAELARARAVLAEADLALERTTVVAPLGGVVLERLATVGDSLAVGEPVCSLFDPTALRIRVDVPQSEVERVALGQSAEVLADARPGRPYAGEVIRLVQRADIQKVTLEAQVRVHDADGLLRPDMLTQVRLFTDAREGPPSQGGASEPLSIRIGVPRRLLDGGPGESAATWILDPEAGVARRRVVELGAAIATGDGVELVEVLSGLSLTDKLIDEGRARVAAADEGEGVPVRVRAKSPTTANRGGGER